jgi:hypothetical protein
MICEKLHLREWYRTGIVCFLLCCVVLTTSGSEDKGGKSCQDDPELTNLVKQMRAFRPDSPYALEAVTLLVRLEQETRTWRAADYRDEFAFRLPASSHRSIYIRPKVCSRKR